MKQIDLMKNGNMYFLIGDRRIRVAEKTFITIGLIQPAEAGDEIHCEDKFYKIDSIDEERPQANAPERTFQKPNVTRLAID